MRVVRLFWMAALFIAVVGLFLETLAAMSIQNEHPIAKALCAAMAFGLFIVAKTLWKDRP